LTAADASEVGNKPLLRYSDSTLDMLIAAAEGIGVRRKHCPLGENVEASKQKIHPCDGCDPFNGMW
jgi:hypothetical protein